MTTSNHKRWVWFLAAGVATREPWLRRIEADWLPVAAQCQLGGMVWTKADAARETPAQVAAKT